MKKLIFIYLLLVSTLLPDMREASANKILERSGLFYYVNEDAPYTGKVIGVNNDGTTFTLNIEGGQYNGKGNIYHSNGNLAVSQNFKNNMKNGLFKWFYEDGQLEAVVYFTNDIPDGTYDTYDEHGNRIVEYNYNNGQLHGEQKDYYDSGQWKNIYTYDDGVKSGKFKEYYENGQLKREGEFKDGILYGAIKRYSALGELKNEKYYDEISLDLRVGLVLSPDGLGDKSFNDSAYKGLKMAEKEFGIEFNYVELASPSEDEGFLREYAEAGYDLVIATGFLMKDAAQKVALDFPEVKFAIIDEVIEADNVSSLLFAEDEGSFLVGALAAMMSKTGNVGFVGGMEIPLIQKFQRGFEEGAKYINKDAKIGVLYTSGPNPFNDPVRGKENALSLIKQGADVVYHAAGRTGLGVIEAAKESGVYAIGVDSNQDAIAEGVVLTSMIKNADVAVYNTIKSILGGEFKSGVNRFGVAEGGVGTTNFHFTKDIIGEEKLAKFEEIKNDIINGDITF